MSTINFSGGAPPETVLPPESDGILHAMAEARAIADDDEQRAAIAVIVAGSPRYLDGWAQLGRLGRGEIESYAMYRVGYHRGLDTLRQNGWRGSGYVRWQHESNRGFLRALAGLQRVAALIGEVDEAERCDQFLRQLDPSWPPVDVDAV